MFITLQCGYLIQLYVAPGDDGLAVETSRVEQTIELT
jgi:hypothetical protein